MKCKPLLWFYFVSLFTNLNAQYISGVSHPDKSKKVISDTMIPQIRYAETITAHDLRQHLSVLSSDDYEGRETGTEGIEKAAKYISDQLALKEFAKAGNSQSYFQPIAFTYTKWKNTTLKVNGERVKFMTEYLGLPIKNNNINYSTDEILFLGYGIHDNRYSDYRNIDVRDKTIIIYKGEPKKENGNYWITGNSQHSLWSDFDNKLKIAKRKGVKMVFVIEENLNKLAAENRDQILGSSVNLEDITNIQLEGANHLYLTTKIAKDIIGEKIQKVIKVRDKINKEGKANSFSIKTNVEVELERTDKVLAGKNILAYVEGNENKEEVVIVSAHYDHVGKRGEDIYNGANDNGSGTSTILEIAEGFQKAKMEGNGPKRSILFLWMTAEEKGLLGSSYYTQNPVFPLDMTIADVNVDMVGRSDNKYQDAKDYIYVIGSDRLSKDLHDINEMANSNYAQLILDYTYNDEKDPNRFYYRSDHYNFARNGIPAIFFFNGVHEDYHRTSDTIEKIDFKAMEKVGKLIFHTTWELANRKNRIVKLENSDE